MVHDRNNQTLSDERNCKMHKYLKWTDVWSSDVEPRTSPSCIVLHKCNEASVSLAQFATRVNNGQYELEVQILGPSFSEGSHMFTLI